ncbi:elongation factor G [Candidatus Izemoplasma sp. B36]|uniref:elongation factor G n=1 Tax=Candidatus Izemoplasma sp. B36 TaxID=3242468 RepID=UPI0035589D6A
MNEYKANAIKNVVILGHLGSGKTSLAESLAFISGQIDKKGSVEKKNTISDFTTEEHNKQSSLSSGLVPVEFKDIKINILDAPGADEMIGDINHVMSVSTAAILVVDASSGVQVGTERMWLEIKKHKLPSLIFINKMDKENVKFDEVLEEIRTKLGKEAVPFCLPLGKSEGFNGFADIVELKARIYDGDKCIDGEIFEDKMDRVLSLREQLVETVAGSDEELLEKYFEGEELTMDEIHDGLHKSVKTLEAVPVMVGSATKDIGSLTLLHMIKRYLPTVSEGEPVKGMDGETEVVRNYSEEEPFSAFVFKTMIDPFIGTINIMQIKSGTLVKDQDVYVSNSENTERAAPVFTLLGKTQIPLEVGHAGDIVAMAKVNNVKTGTTLSEKKNVVVYPQVVTPTPTMYVAVHAENKKDEDKLSNALAKLQLEDNTIEVKRNKETSQLLIGGQGMIHIGYIIDKMKNMFKVALQTEEQRIVYRETIKAQAEATGRYIKQSGGSGYYGVVVMRFEPLKDGGYEFAEEIFGGAVPKGYFPAVDKGLQETLEHGVLAGFPVIGIRGVLTDGKYHAVDSNELAFKMAASIAFKEACKTAKPTILEPIYKVEVTIKDEYLGDVLGDMNKRRGRVLGMEPALPGYQKVVAEAPEQEISKYTIDLKAMTQGSGTFSREFVRYEEVPSNLIDKIVEEQKRYLEEHKK